MVRCEYCNNKYSQEDIHYHTYRYHIFANNQMNCTYSNESLRGRKTYG